MGQAKTVQSFMLILGQVGSLYLWVGLRRVKKIGPTSNCGINDAAFNTLCNIWLPLHIDKQLILSVITARLHIFRESQPSLYVSKMYRMFQKNA